MDIRLIAPRQPNARARYPKSEENPEHFEADVLAVSLEMVVIFVSAHYPERADHPKYEDIWHGIGNHQPEAGNKWNLTSIGPTLTACARPPSYRSSSFTTAQSSPAGFIGADVFSSSAGT
ncbi:hypothetical protein ACVW1C_005533 [Bradyrhizobium sp. USDA 4011]